MEPNGTGDNLWRETVVLVVNDGPVHAAQSIGNLLSLKQSDIAPGPSSLRHTKSFGRTIQRLCQEWFLRPLVNQRSRPLKRPEGRNRKFW